MLKLMDKDLKLLTGLQNHLVFLQDEAIIHKEANGKKDQANRILSLICLKMKKETY